MGRWGSATFLTRGDMQDAAFDGEVGVWRDDVDMIRVDVEPMTRLGDRHRGRPCEQVGQTALVPGVQVLN